MPRFKGLITPGMVQTDSPGRSELQDVHGRATYALLEDWRTGGMIPNGKSCLSARLFCKRGCESSPDWNAEAVRTSLTVCASAGSHGKDLPAHPAQGTAKRGPLSTGWQDFLYRATPRRWLWRYLDRPANLAHMIGFQTRTGERIDTTGILSGRNRKRRRTRQSSKAKSDARLSDAA